MARTISVFTVFPPAAELLDQLGDGFGVWRITGCSSSLAAARNLPGGRFRQLDVGGEVGTGGETRYRLHRFIRQHLEFTVRRTAADRAGIGLRRAEIRPMRLKILLYASYIASVSLLQRLLRGVWKE